jgi:BASS family bile acid:Na+ symporter
MRSTIEEVFRVLLAVLIPLASFTTGLQAPRAARGERRLWRRPTQLGRDLLAVLILVPIWVIAIVLLLPLAPAVRGGLLIATLAVGIGPVAALNRMKSATAQTREALDLNLIVLFISLAFVPIAFAALAALFHAEARVSVAAVAKVVLGRALVPLLLGLGAARLWPRFAASAGPRFMKVINILLLLVLLAAVAVTWKFLAHLGGMAWLACVLISCGAIAIGHALGGPDPGTRGVVAAASVMRFPALALALAAVTPAAHRVIPAILAYIIVSIVLITIYGLVMSRRARRTRANPVVPIGAVPRHA